MKKPHLPVVHMSENDTELARPVDEHIVSTGLSDRLEERTRAYRRLLWRRVGILLGGVAAAALLLWTLLDSPLLALHTEDIHLAGSDGTISAEEVQEVLAGYEGDSLVTLNLTEAGDTVAAELVHVRTASVVRAWPHGLTVTVEPRVAVAGREVDEGIEVLDGEAVVLETVSEWPEGLVSIRPAGDFELSGDQVVALAAAVGALDQQTRSLVSYGTVSETGQIKLVLTSGAIVTWGESTENALKAEVLAVLVTKEAQYYDVSSPRIPTTSS